jgi:hypothetical protein
MDKSPINFSLSKALLGRKGRRKSRKLLKSMDAKLDQIIAGQSGEQEAEPLEKAAGTAGAVSPDGTGATVDVLGNPIVNDLTGAFSSSTRDHAANIYGTESERTAAASASAVKTAQQAAAISGL